ncbi:MAG: hypothetical protein V2A73_16615 [Pseudomonadota bacterium]
MRASNIDEPVVPAPQTSTGPNRRDLVASAMEVTNRMIAVEQNARGLPANENTGAWSTGDGMGAGGGTEKGTGTGVGVGPDNEWQLEPAGGGRLRSNQPAFVATIERDGRVRFEDRPAFQAHWMPLGVRVTFDLTDLAYRLRGLDPYRCEKADFIEDTKTRRDAMADEDQRRRAREALRKLPGALAELWKSPDLSTTQKRRVLFDLWDECAESGPAWLVHAGKEARAIILGFVRARLLQGSDEAFTENELTELNKKRQSQQPFEP